LHPIPELFGGRFGKSHHQDLIHTQLFFQNQSQEQTLNGISFTGTGTGLNQIDAFKGGVRQIEWFQEYKSF
jgi:hypothetical protein